MARLLQVRLTITTGTVSTQAPVRVRINGHILPVTCTSGDTRTGGMFQGVADIRSVVHSLELLGPVEGAWEVERVEAFFEMEQGEPYGHEIGPIRLEAGQAVNIWSATPTFDV